jgi:glucose-6-phosphate isomerase
MLYRHDIEGCLAETVGIRGLTGSELAATLARAKGALKKLKRLRDKGGLPLLALPDRRDDLPALAALADEFRRRFQHVLMLGIGGSSLGGQTFCALSDAAVATGGGAPRLHFLENIDPATFAALFGALDAGRTGIIAISKSGGTAETLAQLVLAFDWLRRSLGSAELGDRLVAITEPRDSPLRRFAQRQHMRILDHDPDIGGRFSVLSNVALLPGLIAGRDAAALREGAASVLEAMLAAPSPREAEPALGAALTVGLAERRGIAQAVLMTYSDRLASFGLWFRQLWAESLGKDGKGMTPVRAMGATDQHSQLQLYLDGPADKMFSLVMLDVAGEGEVLAPDLTGDHDLAFLVGKRIGDVLDAEQRATATSLVRHGRPTRVFRLAQLDERSLGALLMHFMLETIIAAELLGVNAFDQPAVEEGKVLARRYLSEKKD